MIGTIAYTVVEHTHIPLDELLPHPEQVRFYGEDGAQADEKLIASLAQYGQFDDVAVTEILPSGKRYIISGHRRCDALRKLGRTDARCEVRRFESDASQIDVLVQQNFQRDKTERQKNNEAVYFIEFFGREAHLRKLQALKGVCESLCSTEHNGETKGRTSNVVAGKVGESAMTIRRRKFVHYNPDRIGFLEELAAKVDSEDIVRMCLDQWNRIREMNNDGSVSIARAAEMVRTLKKEILLHAHSPESKSSAPVVTRGAARPKQEHKVKNFQRTDCPTSEQKDVFVYNTNGVDCGLSSATGQVMVRYRDNVRLLSWDKIIQHIDVLF